MIAKLLKFLQKKRFSIITPAMTSTESSYFAGIQKAQNEHDITKKIRIYEAQLKTLSQFVNESLKTDGDLPPIMPCRDELPELYMRLGDWKNAERIIKFCINCNAYFPQNGNDELIYLLNYQTAAETALELIREQPGILQRNIYKALKEKKLDDYCLKHFIRCSLQIEKRPNGKTNELYAK